MTEPDTAEVPALRGFGTFLDEALPAPGPEVLKRSSPNTCSDCPVGSPSRPVPQLREWSRS
ncbi:MAG TPA: hypothetical protein VHC18_20060 [Amycolatopsis sp.]|nr:hypothetical protein [Amycolatopsis sp.]